MHLIACSSCARQYDVTHLVPGAQVHCACEAFLTVPQAPALAATALVCTHCGGPVTADDETCAYCSARLAEADRRETTVCPDCCKRIASDSKHCRGCGLAIVPQALQPLPPDQACPRCGGGLRHRSLVHAQVIECTSCHGLWLRPGDFDDLCRTARAKPTGFIEKAPRAPTPVVDAQLLRYIPCLVCGQLMIRRQFRWGGKGSGVVLDACADHGIWLDDEELATIVTFLRSDPAAQQSRPGDWRAPRRTSTGVPAQAGVRGATRSRNAVTDALGWIGEVLTSSIFGV